MSFDFTFTWDGAAAADPWAHLLVARFEAREAISTLYRYEVTLLAQSPAPEVDPDDLIGRSATLRIATVSSPSHRLVHGVIAEIEEVAQSAFGVFYRAKLVPPWERARHRKRSRIFLQKTLRQIIDTVLAEDPAMKLVANATVDDDDGGPGWSAAAEEYTWRVSHSRRLDDARVRSYTVQYNESDHDFVARLLEEEGISYHFEHGPGRCLLVFSDTDTGRAHLDDPVVGPGLPGRNVTPFSLGARMRPGKVTLDDYNWKKPRAPMRADASLKGPAAALTEYVYPGGYPDSPAQGQPLVDAIVDRYAVEAERAVGEGHLRVLSAGVVVKMAHPKPRYEGEYLVTELHITAEQSGVSQSPSDPTLGIPFKVHFECARRGHGTSVSESRFRPARVTPKPRVFGSQTAIVTAEPSSSAEVNVGGPDGLSIGCVRVKFFWDRETSRHAKEPTSCWVRVSQVFAGAGQGAVWHPRVGVEVVVEHENGDPDRPIVTGRVYNGKNLPPYGGSPVHSTFKSFSTPGGGAWNEVTYNDTAGSELVFINAGKDMTTNVANDRLETVGESAEMHVGVDNTETIGANQVTTVGANDTMTIGANQVKSIGANRSRDIGANHSKTVSANEQHTISGNQTITVSGTLTEKVGGAVEETYSSTRTTHVSGEVEETFSAQREVTVSGLVLQSYGAPQEVHVKGTRVVTVNGFMGVLIGGEAINKYHSTLTTEVGSVQLVISGGTIEHVAPTYDVHAPLKLHILGLKAEAIGVNMKAIGLGLSLTGISASLTLLSSEKNGFKLSVHPGKEEETGPDIKRDLLKLRVGAARITTCAIWIFI